MNHELMITGAIIGDDTRVTRIPIEVMGAQVIIAAPARERLRLH